MPLLIVEKLAESCHASISSKLGGKTISRRASGRSTRELSPLNFTALDQNKEEEKNLTSTHLSALSSEA